MFNRRLRKADDIYPGTPVDAEFSASLQPSRCSAAPLDANRAEAAAPGARPPNDREFPPVC